MARIFGTRKVRETYAAINGGPDLPAYPELPVKLIKLIFETPCLVNRRHDTYAVIIDGSMMHADEVEVSNWLLRHWGEHLTSNQFAIAQDLLCDKVRCAIEEDMKSSKRKQEFTRENYLQGNI